jgi:homocysteine S-methyltransferase
MANLLDAAQDSILIGDGATGSYLHDLGIPWGACLEEANLRRPELVRQVYTDYIAAGARMIETNSFGANRVRLALHGLEHQVSEINWKAASLARDAAEGRDVFVVGSVGPIGGRPTDLPLTVSEKREVFREQMGALLDGGCQAIFLEAFTRLDDILEALDVFQNLSNVPVATLLGPSEEGRLESGEKIAEAFQKLRAAGADIVGWNGTLGPQASVGLLSQLEIASEDLLAVFPNGGKPAFYDGGYRYNASPEYLAGITRRLVAEGARLIGGDYGTGPEHIKAMVAAAQSLTPVRMKSVKRSASISANTVPPPVATPTVEESILDQVKHRVVNIVELDSPKTLSMEKFLKGCQALKDAGAAAVTLADNSLAILRVSNFAAAVLIREKVGLTPLLHMACRDRNLLGIQSELMGFGALGFRHVLAITGDPAKVGDHPGASSVYDVNSLGLLKLMQGLNDGVNAVGKPLNGKTEFVIGCAFNPNALNFDSQVKKLESKLKAGAQYVMTQPVFDPVLARKTAERLKPLGVPVFLGVMPLLHSRNAEFLHNEVPGISIPENVRTRLRNATEVEGPAIGLELAREIRAVAHEFFNGAYLITPFLKWELSVELL